MGAKEAFYNRIRQKEKEALEEGIEPKIRIVPVPKSMRPTEESLEKMGRRIAAARKRNSTANKGTDLYLDLDI